MIIRDNSDFSGCEIKADYRIISREEHVSFDEVNLDYNWDKLPNLDGVKEDKQSCNSH